MDRKKRLQIQMALDKTFMYLCFILAGCFIVLFTSYNIPKTPEIKSTQIVSVKEGDNVWDIANEIKNQDNIEIDVRQIVSDIYRINNLNGHIVPYQKIKVPKYSE